MRLAFATIVAVLGSQLALATPAPGAPQPAGRGLIAFSRCGPDGCGVGSDVWVIHENGAGLTRLTRAGRHNESPSWSPNGAKIAYVSGSAFVDEIWTMDASGRNRRRLTGPAVVDSQPAWSPDGRRIVFVRGQSQRGRQLYVIGADGRGLRRITHDAGDYRHPDWSPDGHSLVFSYTPNPDRRNYALFVSRADGSGRHRITPEGRKDYWDPAWSPDGRRLAYSYIAPIGRTYAGDLETIDLTGGNRRVVLKARPDTVYFSPSWSPDGTQLTFVTLHKQDGIAQLSFVHADGSGFRILKELVGDTGAPAWQPAGARG